MPKSIKVLSFSRYFSLAIGLSLIVPASASALKIRFNSGSGATNSFLTEGDVNNLMDIQNTLAGMTMGGPSIPNIPWSAAAPLGAMPNPKTGKIEVVKRNPGTDQISVSNIIFNRGFDAVGSILIIDIFDEHTSGPLEEGTRLFGTLQMDGTVTMNPEMGSTDRFTLVGYLGNPDGFPGNIASHRIPGPDPIEIFDFDGPFNVAEQGFVQANLTHRQTFGIRLVLDDDSKNGYSLTIPGSINFSLVPEPLTILGAGTAIGFGAFFKRTINKKKKKKGKKDSESA